MEAAEAPDLEDADLPMGRGLPGVRVVKGGAVDQVDPRHRVERGEAPPAEVLLSPAVRRAASQASDLGS